jgi:hypothetical protein
VAHTRHLPVRSTWRALRVDHANRILGLRLNIWTSIIIFGAAVAFLILGRRGQPDPVTSPGAATDESAADDRPTDSIGP